MRSRFDFENLAIWSLVAGIISAALGCTTIKRSDTARTGLEQLLISSAVLPAGQSRSRYTLDYKGAALMIVSITSLVLVTTWGGTDFAWASPVIIILTATSVVTAITFVMVERRAAVPMLPLELSTDICSLRPNVERLVLSCIMEIDHAGEVASYKINEGIIRSAGLFGGPNTARVSRARCW